MTVSFPSLYQVCFTFYFFSRSDEFGNLTTSTSLVTPHGGLVLLKTVVFQFFLVVVEFFFFFFSFIFCLVVV